MEILRLVRWILGTDRIIAVIPGDQDDITITIVDKYFRIMVGKCLIILLIICQMEQLASLMLMRGDSGGQFYTPLGNGNLVIYCWGISGLPNKLLQGYSGIKDSQGIF